MKVEIKFILGFIFIAMFAIFTTLPASAAPSAKAQKKIAKIQKQVERWEKKRDRCARFMKKNKMKQYRRCTKRAEKKLKQLTAKLKRLGWVPTPAELPPAETPDPLAVGVCPYQQVIDDNKEFLGKIEFTYDYLIGNYSKLTIDPEKMYIDMMLADPTCKPSYRPIMKAALAAQPSMVARTSPADALKQMSLSKDQLLQAKQEISDFINCSAKQITNNEQAQTVINTLKTHFTEQFFNLPSELDSGTTLVNTAYFQKIIFPIVGKPYAKLSKTLCEMFSKSTCAKNNIKSIPSNMLLYAFQAEATLVQMKFDANFSKSDDAKQQIQQMNRSLVVLQKHADTGPFLQCLRSDYTKLVCPYTQLSEESQSLIDSSKQALTKLINNNDYRKSLMPSMKKVVNVAIQKTECEDYKKVIDLVVDDYIFRYDDDTFKKKLQKYENILKQVDDKCRYLANLRDFIPESVSFISPETVSPDSAESVSFSIGLLSLLERKVRDANIGKVNEILQEIGKGQKLEFISSIHHLLAQYHKKIDEYCKNMPKEYPCLAKNLDNIPPHNIGASVTLEQSLSEAKSEGKPMPKIEDEIKSKLGIGNNQAFLKCIKDVYKVSF